MQRGEPMTRILVKVSTSVPERNKEVQGALYMDVRKDDPTDSYLGFMPSLKIYAQGHTPQETERMMERAAALYLKIAIQDNELEKILLHRRFVRVPPVPHPRPTEILSVRTIVPDTERKGPDESGMELEFAGAQ